MLKDFQSTGGNDNGRKYYDEEEYDVFWAAVQELGVLVYFHRRWPP
jgi:predicted TIM-barrel fold metal-dependent hydrolase